MISTDWSNAPYELMIPLWRLWLAEDNDKIGRWPLLDRWLTRNSSLSRSGSRSPNKTQRTPAENKTQLALSAAMFSAMRFLQLAAALEHSYRAQNLDLDWAAWDSEWSAAEIHKVPPAAFWFWIALRESADASDPAMLRDAAARSEWFREVQARVPLVNDAEARGLVSQDSISDVLPVDTGTALGLLWQGLRPQWADLLQQRAGSSGWSSENLHRFVLMQNEAPPLWLRPQKQLTASELAQDLQREGVDVVLDEHGLRAQGGAGVFTTSAYKNGAIEIQDLASQHIAACVGAKPGDKVWDACAGAGGKSLAIAARMTNKGMVLATDLHSYKLNELKRRAKRAEVFNIRTFEWQGREALRLPAEVARQQGFDWVLVDAPCTSAGTWRRNPDARWRFSGADTAELLELQRDILHNASTAVRRGGHLVYATCSWQVSENETQLRCFLDTHPEFTLISGKLVGAPELNADTMFVALLQRNVA